MNSKSFAFGKNYDSDYLSGRRLKRKSYGPKNPQNMRRRKRKIGPKVDNTLENPNLMERHHKKLGKTYDKRLTLNPKPIDSSADTYRKDLGLFANGKTSNVVNNDWVLKDRKQLKDRIKEDLFWILQKKSRNKHQVIEDSPPQQKTRPSLRHKPNNNEKETQINSVMSFDSRISEDDIQLIPNEDKQIYRSYRSKRIQNPFNDKKSIKTQNKSPEKGFTKLKVNTKLNCFKPKLNYNRSEENKSIQTSQKVMPSLPTSLSVVQNLMNSYENERKDLSHSIQEFKTDLMSKRCDRIKQISKSFKQSIEQNFVRSNNYLNVEKRTIDLPEKTPKVTNDKSTNILSGDSVRPLSVVPYNPNEAQMALKQFEPKVGVMLSKLLSDISDAFQTLSSKCVEKSFFE